MSYASEKLHKGYLRRKMPTIVSKVKVREIMIHLPCLTDHDRETIEAKRETNGNFDGMVLLLECLKRRENWPEQLIEALEACEHTTIAAEIRAEYNTLRGINDSNPSLPSTTVVSAHVHPPPSASQLPIAEGSGKSQATVTPSGEASVPPEPVAPPENPVQPQASQSPAAHFPKAVSLPVLEPPQPTQIKEAPLPSTPPPSPETQHTTANTPLAPQRKVSAHQEPEENSESNFQDIAGDMSVIADQVRTGNGRVSSVVTPPPSRPVEQSETDTVPSESLQTAVTITEVRPPQSPSPSQTHSDVTDESSSHTLTPQKPPVQDTTPPVEKVPAACLEPEEMSEPETAQVVESRPQTEKAAAASPLPGVAVVDASVFDDGTVCLSKPGQLISIQPQNHDTPNIPSPPSNSPVAPYSGNSERLEISDGAPDTVTSAPVPACSAVTPIIENTVSGVSCQENGIANHNEPEENHYESPCQSLEMQEVRENVVHISEEVSILNLDGQTSTPQAQMINSETAREITSGSPFSTAAADTVSSLNAHSSENYHPSEPAPVKVPSQLPDPEENGASRILTDNMKYIILTAAGVGAFALFIAWKFRN